MSVRLISAACALALFAGGTQLAAQRAQKKARAPMRFQAMDTNRDGRIARAEWRGSDQSFRVHDWNGDGVLSGEEVRPGAERATAASDGPTFDSPDREYEFTDWTERGFVDLDHNKDGRITLDEWHFRREGFRRADHDANGVISRAEFLNSDFVDDDRGDLFVYLDANHDNRVSRAEWHGGVAAFNVLDANKDGVLTRGEMDGDGPPEDLFASVDVNRDGSIGVNEWHWSRQSFDDRDTNRDGRLTRAEFTGAESAASRTPAYRAGYERGVLEGRQAGKEDGARHTWDLEGQQELEQADSGYDARFGPRGEYQAGYRDGFRGTYREGWNSTNK